MPLDFLICGLEHSGTTLLSDLMRQVPGCDSGFECGVLLGRKPSDFLDMQPFCSNILKGWEISQDDLNACVENVDFAGFYDELYKRSHLFQGEKQPSIRFDKTPRYISCIHHVAKNVPDVPILAMIKDPAAIAWSDFKRSGLKMEDIYGGHYLK